MKHLKKHLALSRETVRHLSATELAHLGGGITTTQPVSVWAGHGCTSFTNCECPAIVNTQDACGTP